MPHAMQDDRKFSGQGAPGLLEANAFGQPEPSDLALPSLGHADEQHASSLEEVCPDHGIAEFENTAGPTDLARSMAARCQSEVSADASGASEATWFVHRSAERQGFDRSNIRPGHEMAPIDVVPCQGQVLPGETDNLSTHDLAHAKQGADGLAVAMMVVEDGVEIAFGLEAAARQMKLGFVPVLSERFDLVVDRKAWFDPPF